MIRIRYDGTLQYGDLVRTILDGSLRNLDNTDEAALETAVLISLFTERRADPEDIGSNSEIEIGEYKGGWWADSFSDVNWGSRLWTLKRSVLSVTTLQRARAFAIESLQWMVDDNAASTVEVTATNAGNGILCLQTDITTPGSDTPFARLWEVKLNAL